MAAASDCLQQGQASTAPDEFTMGVPDGKILEPVQDTETELKSAGHKPVEMPPTGCLRIEGQAACVAVQLNIFQIVQQLRNDAMTVRVRALRFTQTITDQFGIR